MLNSCQPVKQFLLLVIFLNGCVYVVTTCSCPDSRCMIKETERGRCECCVYVFLGKRSSNQIGSKESEASYVPSRNSSPGKHEMRLPFHQVLSRRNAAKFSERSQGENGGCQRIFENIIDGRKIITNICLDKEFIPDGIYSVYDPVASARGGFEGNVQN